MTIYRILCRDNNKSYVGQTTNYKQRVCYHKTYLKRGVHSNSYLQRSYNKYGIKAFEFSILEECSSLEELNEAEIRWIAFYKGAEEGFNIQLGGYSDRPSERGLKKLREKAQKQNRAISQYDLEGNFLKDYPSIKAAAAATRCSSSEIMRVCKRENIQAHNFQFRYKEDETVVGKVLSLFDRNSQQMKALNKLKGKVVYQYSLEGFYVNSYESVSEAARINGFRNMSQITNCTSGRCQSAYGFKWRYENDAQRTQK